MPQSGQGLPVTQWKPHTVNFGCPARGKNRKNASASEATATCQTAPAGSRTSLRELILESGIMMPQDSQGNNCLSLNGKSPYRSKIR